MIGVEHEVDVAAVGLPGASVTMAASSFFGRPSSASRTPSRPAAITEPAPERRKRSIGRSKASPVASSPSSASSVFIAGDAFTLIRPVDRGGVGGLDLVRLAFVVHTATVRPESRPLASAEWRIPGPNGGSRWAWSRSPA